MTQPVDLAQLTDEQLAKRLYKQNHALTVAEHIGEDLNGILEQARSATKLEIMIRGRHDLLSSSEEMSDQNGTQIKGE